MNTTTEDKELEQKITTAIAETCNFELHEKFAKCNECGRRLMYSYIGHPLNERMLQHRAGHTGQKYIGRR